MAHGDSTRTFSGAGEVYVSRRVSGKPVDLQFVGNVKELSFAPKVERKEHREKQTGNDSIDQVMERMLDLEISMKQCSFDSDSIGRMIYGTKQETASSTVTAETHTATPGRLVKLNGFNVTSITSVTDVGGGTTYTEGTDWEIQNLAAGMICIIEGGAITNPEEIEVNYERGESEKVGAFTRPNEDFYFVFTGLNVAESNAPVVITAFKVRLDPVNDIPLINEDFTEYELSGKVLFDKCRPAGSSNYFEIEQLKYDPALAC